jgi:hypothetical protein
VRGGTLSIREVRPKACMVNYAAPNLSTGECAVIGSVAVVGFQVKVTPAKQVGDVASLAAQLGAADVNVNNGGLPKINRWKTRRCAKPSPTPSAKPADRRILGTTPGPDPAHPGLAGQRDQQLSRPRRLHHSTRRARTSGRSRPSNSAPLAMTPPPITRSARITVTYSLLP